MAHCLNMYASSHALTGAWGLFDGIDVGKLSLLMKPHSANQAGS